MKTLIIFLTFIFSYNAFSDPQIMYPTPEGFTKYPDKALQIQIYIPPQVEKNIYNMQRKIRTQKKVAYQHELAFKNIGRSLNHQAFCASALAPLIGKGPVFRSNNKSYRFSMNRPNTKIKYNKGYYNITCSYAWYPKGSSPIYFIKDISKKFNKKGKAAPPQKFPSNPLSNGRGPVKTKPHHPRGDLLRNR